MTLGVQDSASVASRVGQSSLPLRAANKGAKCKKAVELLTSREELNSVNVLTDRVEKRRQEFLAAKPHICAEKAVLYAKGWRESEGDPVDIRWAKVQKAWMEGIPVVIWDGELIVGHQGKYIRSAQSFIEWSTREILDGLENAALTAKSETELADITEEERRELVEAAHYWQGKSVEDVIIREERRIMGDDWMPIRWNIPGAGIFSGVTASSNQFANDTKILEGGLRSIVEEAKARKSSLTFLSAEDYRKDVFYEAVIIACESVRTWAGRYAELARSMAATEPDATRKAELLKIAEVCDWVPWNPARNFHEALQSFWFVNLALGGHACIGRVDQFFYPYYEKDVKERKLTPQQAAELLGLLYVKLAEVEQFFSLMMKAYGQAGRFNQITIGGVDRQGKDATNDLSYLWLETARQTKLPLPLSLRYHKDMDEDFLIRAIETNMDVCGGVPAFLNDDQAIPMLVRRGITLEDARGWSTGGCIYPFVAEGCSEAFYGLEMNVAKAIEWVLFNGMDPMTGLKAGTETGDPTAFASFEEFYDAVKRQLDFQIDRHVKGMHLHVEIRNSVYSQPLRSAVLDGCLESGNDYGRGGCKYPYFNTRIGASRGLPNLVDSVVAIKKLVFEDKKVSMAELVDALRNNWEGREDLRRMCISAPKYGNDDAVPDEIMRELSAHLQKRILSHKSPWGQPIRPTWQGGSGYYFFGTYTGATPDGRKNREILADAPLSPMSGRRTQGPTATMNSALRADHMSYGDSTMLNMKFSPGPFKTPEGMQKFLALLRTYFDNGGYHVQLNMVNKEILEKAKAHPERYRDLVVRVAGYSAFFVELSPEVQDQLIAREELVM